MTTISVRAAKGGSVTVEVPLYWRSFKVEHREPDRQLSLPFMERRNTIFVWDNSEGQIRHTAVGWEDL